MGNAARIVDIRPLFADDARSRAAAVDAVGATLEADGAFLVAGLAAADSLNVRGAARLLAFFDLPETEKHRLGTRRVRSDSPRSYRGYVSTLKDGWAYNEFFDIGPARALPRPALAGAAIFAEANIWPQAEPYPGWRGDMLAYRRAMETIGGTLLAAAGRYLGLSEAELGRRFAGAGSTLRLLNYPRKPRAAAIEEEMPRPDETPLVTGRHVDACALSLLWQREPGLQAEAPDGRWLDIPLRAGCVSVHIGTVMEFLTDGRWRATPHRVVDTGAARGSIGYFHEPNLNASLAPLISANSASPPAGTATYGAHLLERFARYDGLEDLAG
jgi:isopenicillin N synthase-like dioxygenase